MVVSQFDMATGAHAIRRVQRRRRRLPPTRPSSGAAALQPGIPKVAQEGKRLKSAYDQTLRISPNACATNDARQSLAIMFT